MTEYSGYYKWSYDSRNESLKIWAVDSSLRYAAPTHHDTTGEDGLLNCSQGRLVVEDGKARAVIYASRPMNPDLESRREAIQDAAQDTLEDELGMDVVWRYED